MIEVLIHEPLLANRQQQQQQHEQQQQQQPQRQRQRQQQQQQQQQISPLLLYLFDNNDFQYRNYLIFPPRRPVGYWGAFCRSKTEDIPMLIEERLGETSWPLMQQMCLKEQIRKVIHVLLCANVVVKFDQIRYFYSKVDDIKGCYGWLISLI